MGVEKTPAGLQETKKYTVSPRFHLLMITITTIILMGVFYQSTRFFRTDDPLVSIAFLTPQKITDFGGNATTVETGMYIKDFPDFDMVQGNFILDVTVWFRFDPHLISLERIKEFTFAKAEILYRSLPYASIDNGDLFVRFDVRMKYNMQLNYSSFPIDDHRLNFILVNNIISPADAIFKSSRNNFSINHEIEIAGWNYVDRQVRVGYIEVELDSSNKGHNVYSPCVVFSVDYNRLGLRHTISIFLPLLMIFYMALFSFSMNPHKVGIHNIVSKSSAAIMAVLAYRFVIDNMSPQSSFFMVSDYIFIFFLLMMSIILLVNIFGARINAYQKKIITVLLHVLTIVVFIYFLAL